MTLVYYIITLILYYKDQVMSLQMLRLFNGYLNALSDEIAHLLRCHVHLHRITIALCAILKLDCTSVKVLDTAKSGNLFSSYMCMISGMSCQNSLYG